jgi:hypothetical protein
MPCLSFVRVTFVALDHYLVVYAGYGLKELGFVQFGYPAYLGAFSGRTRTG